MQMISSYGYTNKNNQNSNNKKVLKLVVVSIVVVLLISAILIGAIYYINLKEQRKLKLSVDNKSVKIKEDTFIMSSDGKIYVAIKDIAKSLGYDARNGEYKINSEDKNKCYVENENETASFYLNSNKINKVAPNSKDEYTSFDISEPVIKENDKLYVISDGLQIGCNVKLSYDKNTNTIKISTLPKLVSSVNALVIQQGYKGLSEDFNNQKAILYNMYVVKNASEKYGVIDGKYNDIIGCKYENIKFNESTKEFFVTNTLKKVGIVLSNGDNKINIEYDEIKVLDKEKELYLVKNDNKYGIIDKNGATKVNVGYEDIKVLDKDLGLYVVKYNDKYGVIDSQDKQIVYWEYDSIGIDTKNFSNSHIKNSYLLFDNAIPVKIGEKWGLFDTKGNKILECEYDSIGCIASGVKDKVVNNVLIVPECECIVVGKDKKYGLVYKNGDALLQIVIDAIYSTTSAGKTTYYMSLNNNGEIVEYELLWYLEQFGLYTPPDKDKKEDNTTSNTLEDNNVTENIQSENNIESQTL